MLEPENNPNPAALVDPPNVVRFLGGKAMSRRISTLRRERLRLVAEKKRVAEGRRHVVEYFHQLDDPYSHLSAQVVARFSERYDIELVPHLIRATGGKHQPEEEKLAVWARRDCGLIAPHYGLAFPETAGVVPDQAQVEVAANSLADCSAESFLQTIEQVSGQLWSGSELEQKSGNGAAAMDEGSERLAELGHYSGAMFYYEGEWYWGGRSPVSSGAAFARFGCL